MCQRQARIRRCSQVVVCDVIHFVRRIEGIRLTRIHRERLSHCRSSTKPSAAMVALTLNVPAFVWRSLITTREGLCERSQHNKRPYICLGRSVCRSTGHATCLFRINRTQPGAGLIDFTRSRHGTNPRRRTRRYTERYRQLRRCVGIDSKVGVGFWKVSLAYAITAGLYNRLCILARSLGTVTM